jgi:endonuclease YncB( thermonuclease family)
VSPAASPAAGRAPSGRALAAGALVALLAWPHGAATGRRAPGVAGAILLDGQRTEVRWTDGDSFRVDSGPLRGSGTRLVGVNALEAYGPVHRIGTLGPQALLDLASRSAGLLAARVWRCATTGRRDGYGRALVDCPAAAAALVEAGHAMVYAVDGPADPGLLALQREAQARRVGLWAGGVPAEILTSLHSAGERGPGGAAPYDRLVDTRTGAARKAHHQRRYRTCEEVCAGEGGLRSCLVHVPFERRYRDRPDCLGPRP